MARLADVSPGDLITSQRQNDINDYIEDGTEYLITASAQLVGVSAAPSDGDLALGRLYADSDDNKLYFYNGSSWVDVASGQQTYDAIVDSAGGGDYTTLGAAITAGAVTILLKGLTTETGDITLPNYCLIHGADGNEWIVMGTNTLTLGVNNVLSNFFIRSTRVTGHQIIVGDSCRFEGMRFQNNSATNPASAQGVISDNNVAATRVMFNNCQMQVQNNTTDIPNMIGIYILNSGSNGWEINNMSFAGQGPTYNCGLVNCATDGLLMNNIFVKNIGQVSASSFTVSGNGCTFTNFHIDSTNVFDITISGDRNSLSNWRTEHIDIDVLVDGLYNNLTNISCEGQLIIGAAANLNMCSNSQFSQGISVAGDNNTITGVRAGEDAGGGVITITTAAGADNTNITGCMVDATISDSGTNTNSDFVIY